MSHCLMKNHDRAARRILIPQATDLAGVHWAKVHGIWTVMLLLLLLSLIEEDLQADALHELMAALLAI